jgi:hypothetical protein
MRVIIALAALVACIAVPAAPAYANVIWTGDASRGSVAGTFGIDNCDSPGTIAAITDPAHGPVWRFTKPAGDNRCEAHGIKVGGSMYHFTDNATYYLGWSTRLTSTVDNNAIFQWKSYGNHVQNYPVVLKALHGRLTILNRQPGGEDHYPWSSPLGTGTWNHVVLGIHTSDALQGGWIELYLNGVPQKFSNGSTRWPCRTWDSSNDPKWGVYGAEGTTVVNDVDDLRVGTAYPDVAAAGAVRPSPSVSASASPSASTSASASPGTGGSDVPVDAVPAPSPVPVAADGPVGGTSAVVWVVAAAVLVLAGGGAGLVVLRRRRPGSHRDPRVSART